MRKDIIYCAIIATLLAFGLNQCHSNNSSKQLIAAEEEKVRIWTDKSGRDQAEATVLKIDLATFKSLHADVVDSLKKEIGTAKIKNVTIVTRKVTDTLLIVRDTRGLINVSDKYTHIWQPDSSRISYSISDSLSITSYSKRYGFLHLKSKDVTRISNSNPHVRMNGATSYEIEKNRKLGVGLIAGYGIGRDGITHFVGAGIYYRIF